MKFLLLCIILEWYCIFCLNVHARVTDVLSPLLRWLEARCTAFANRSLLPNPAGLPRARGLVCLKLLALVDYGFSLMVFTEIVTFYSLPPFHLRHPVLNQVAYVSYAQNGSVGLAAHSRAHSSNSKESRRHAVLLQEWSQCLQTICCSLLAPSWTTGDSD